MKKNLSASQAKRSPAKQERELRAELYERARARNIQGRSRMTKKELARALARSGSVLPV